MCKISTLIGAGMMLTVGMTQAMADPTPRAPRISCETLLKAKGSIAYGAASDDAINYIKSMPNGDKWFGAMSNCNLSDLVGAECKLHRNVSVLAAIYSLMYKAEIGKKLPDSPQCGA